MVDMNKQGLYLIEPEADIEGGWLSKEIVSNGLTVINLSHDSLEKESNQHYKGDFL